jgi:predicted  nucleic acid-binding Zn-ribbon protein
MDRLLQPITQKIQLIGQNLGTNNGFISRIKTELTGIRNKLNQVVQTRALLQTSLNEKQKTIDDLTKRNNATQILIQQLTEQRNASDITAKQLQGDIQNAQGNFQKKQQELEQAQRQMEQINVQLTAARTAAQQNKETIDRMRNEKQGLEQTIGALDKQISQIATVVSTQTRMLDPANEGDDNNLFNHIKGINDTLNGILQMPPGMNLGPGPSPNFGNRGGFPPGGAGGNPNGGYSDFGSGSGSGFSPGGAGGNPDGSPGSGSDSGLGNNLLRRNDSGSGSDSDSGSDFNPGLGLGLGQNLNNQRRLVPDSLPLQAGQNPVTINPRVFPNSNFNNGNNIYQQPQFPKNGGQNAVRKTRRKRRNKKTKKGGRKSMHKRARTKK